MSLAGGTRVGPYQITALIGAGGMGEVYRAHDDRLDRDIALKLLPATWFADGTARARLLREARAAVESRGILPRASTSFRGSPGTYSMAMYGWPSASATS